MELWIMAEKHRSTLWNEKLHGFRPGHTRGYPERARVSFMGNTFHCVAVAYLLASWGILTGYVLFHPLVHHLWEQA
eukprot:9464357-Karenia_brevis.AAC.1